MSTTTRAVLRISSRSRFIRHIRAIDTQYSRTRPAISRNFVNDHVQPVGFRAAVLDHCLCDRLAKPTLLFDRTPRPHVNLHDWHKSLLKNAGCQMAPAYSYKEVVGGIGVAVRPALLAISSARRRASPKSAGSSMRSTLPERKSAFPPTQVSAIDAGDADHTSACTG